MHNRSPKDDVLVGGLDDWAYAAWVYGSTRLSGLEDPGLRRTLTVPLLAKAQARMLAEGVTDAALPAAELPDDLRPHLPFNDAQIRDALPDSDGFGWRDLRLGGSLQ
ncbi:MULTISPECIES: hypothetical protein [unclassified Cryobacterium]|uniref:Uncharacterized protein n=3 Tax=Bacteria TaxID=2 RepID=A0ABY2IQ98_9MICO|nr:MULTISPECIES: hypothetical protein [unclassified Cryobacterium]TFC20371.1 hypothetical protein E3O46_09095 [Cryobacterium glucosi]MDY7528875.1 hypothetical protein [Cryobacterium sp. 10C2]MEB0288077.1 hypothetical protein [Cryobacterium sp. 10S3]MEB0291925.1 hypothetical protein [Cryobacterium sp. 10C2]TFC22201.1 hypothetical protein E3O51_02220 [Cryobacterium sp. MDB2-10]